MRFKFTIGNRIFHADMTDNDIVREVAKHLPFEATYTRYTEHEYYTRLPLPYFGWKLHKRVRRAQKRGVVLRWVECFYHSLRRLQYSPV